MQQVEKIEYESGQVDWDDIDITVFHCPKCQEVGGLFKSGWAGKKNRKWRRFGCTKCEEIVTELQLLRSLPDGIITQLLGGKAPPKPAASNNNSPLGAKISQLEEGQARLEAMLTQLLEGKGVEPEPTKEKPESKVTEATDGLLVKPWARWDKYSLETQDRVRQELLPILREHFDWTARDLQEEVKKRSRYSKALRLQVIVEVRDAFVQGVFGL